MKIYKLILIMVVLSGCGSAAYDIPVQEATTTTTSSLCTVTNVAVGQPGAPNGGSLLSCPDGSSSLTLNGTIITPIQFCPGVTTTYPNTFSEVGWCVDGDLYAVYSIPNAFMTLIPPGSYTSNGINSSCNFTVGTNCMVVQN